MIRKLAIAFLLFATLATAACLIYPLDVGNTSFDVAYGRFLDARRKGGEMSDNDARFHRLAAREFQEPGWEERLGDPAKSLIIRRYRAILNLAYASYDPQDRHGTTGEWSKFLGSSAVRYIRSRSGSYFTMRVPFWIPLVLFVAYPSIVLLRTPLGRRGLRKTGKGLWMLLRTGFLLARREPLRVLGIAVLVLMTLASATAWVSSYLRPFQYHSRYTQTVSERSLDRMFYPIDHEFLTVEQVFLNAKPDPDRRHPLEQPLAAYSLGLNNGMCTIRSDTFVPEGVDASGRCSRCGLQLRQTPFFCPQCMTIGTRKWGHKKLIAFEDHATQSVYRRTTDVFIPLYLPFLVIAICTTVNLVLFARGPLRRWRRQKQGSCLTCGYALEGNVTGVCPECGTRIEQP